jgi:hypothetical protein
MSDSVTISREAAKEILQQLTDSYGSCENIHGASPEDDADYMELKQALEDQQPEKEKGSG